MTNAALPALRRPTSVTLPVHAHNQLQVGPFAVYRAARARDWQATPAELAEVTGLTAYQVRRILRDRGWRLHKPDRETDGSPPLLMDQFH